MKECLYLLVVCLSLSYLPLSAQEQISNLIERASDGDSRPDQFIELNGKYIFSASHPAYGRELWITDGTANGTSLIKDINQTQEGSLSSFFFPRNLARLNGKLYFIANDGVNGEQIWETDGTPEGTLLTATMNGFDTDVLTAVGDKIFFTITLKSEDSGNRGFELWSLDPDTQTFTLIKDDFEIRNSPANKVSYLGLYFFAAQPKGSNNVQLWRSDGTEAGTFPITNEIDGIGVFNNTSSLSQFTVLGDHLYLVFRDAAQAKILKTDGTRAGTIQSSGLFSTIVSYPFGGSVVVNDKIYFSFYTDEGDNFHIYSQTGEPFRATREFSGKSLIPSNMVVMGDKLLFMASAGFNGVGLMQLNLNNGQVSVLANLETTVTPRQYESFLRGYLTPTSDDQVLISYLADDFEQNTHLYNLTSGTLTDVNIGFQPELIQTSFGILYNHFGQEEGNELWKAGPSVDDASPVTNINQQKLGIRANRFISNGSKIVFWAKDEVSGFEPRVYDEASETLSVLHEIFPGSDEGSGALHLFTWNDQFYYFARNTDPAMALYRTDGTPGQIDRLATIEGPGIENYPYQAVIFKDQLWTATFTSLRRLENGNFITVRDFEPPNPVGANFSIFGLYPTEETLFIRGATSLFATDGTAAGIVELPDPGRGTDFLTVGNTLYTVHKISNSVWELWKSDGTTSGTTKIRNLTPNPGKLYQFGNNVVFTAATEEAGRELWISDGTESGTRMITDIRTGALSSVAEPSFATLNGAIYFAANNGSDGMELWRTDGTSLGTQMVSNVVPGAGSSQPRFLYSFKDKIYFTARNASSGNELWETDGTSAGTKLTFDLVTGSVSSHARPVVNTDEDLYFLARSNESGYQLWRINEVVVGIEDQAFDKSINVYPNPASDLINIKFSSSPLGTQMELLGSDAQRYSSVTLDDQLNQSIDLSGLPKGIYIMRFITKDQRVSIKKILKVD